MHAPRGYTLGASLSAGTQSEVYAAVRTSDGVDAVLKSYVGDMDAGDGSRAARELASVQAVAGEGIIEALDLIDDRAPPILVLRRAEGVSLRQWAGAWAGEERISPAAFLDVAVQAAQALARVHKARLVHRDICPGNLVVDPATRKTVLIDFGLARPLGAAVERAFLEIYSSGQAGPDHGMAGTLRYTAPEQTGRMGRGVDSRSDLYSLGATFYFALLGVPPFDTDDPLALIHAHMARLPIPPKERRPELPLALSRIIMKLLQKEPEDRYQTAQALARDLEEAKAQLQANGLIDDEMPLGAGDAPLRPLFTKRLYGREEELEALHHAYARVQRGGTELVVVSGPPGSGKSALVQELSRALPESGGYLASGKFDQYRRDIPYSGVVAALESLVHQLLAEPEHRLTACRDALLESLGNIAAVAVELVPDLGLILGKVPPVPELGGRETRARLLLAVRRLIRGFAKREHPLVLFLDDLQWADPASLDLLEAVLQAGDAEAFLVLGAHRDDEVGQTHALHGLLERCEGSSLRVTRLRMRPLETSACAKMLADVLLTTTDATQRLAEYIVRKTGSNPLLIREFVLHMHDLGRIYYVHPRGWKWDEEGIAASGIPEGAVGLMMAKIGRLDAEARELLKFASCVRDEFDSKLLAALSGKTEARIQPSLFALAEEGLITPSSRGMRFVHDRIREAAQALLSEEQRIDLHHRVGVRLLAATSLEAEPERAFELADHLNRAASALSEEERRQAMQINLATGMRAMSAGASATAHGYLSAGCALFEESDWRRDPTMAFTLLFTAANVAYQTRDFGRALSLIEGLETRPLQRGQELRTVCARIKLSIRSRLGDPLALTLDSLRKMGLRWSRNPSRMRVRLAILYTDWLLRGDIERRVFPTAEGEARARLAPVEVIGAGGAAMQSASVGLLGLATAYILRVYWQHGVTKSPAFAMAAYASYRLRFRRDLRGVARYARIASAWTEAHPDPVLDVGARFNLWAFLNSWLEPRRRVADVLWSLVEAASEVGEVDYRDYAAREHLSYLALSGEPLTQIQKRIEFLRQHAHAREFRFARWYEDIYRMLYQSEVTQADWTSARAAADESLKRPAVQRVHRHLHWMIVLCFHGRYAEAEPFAELLVEPVLALGSPGGYIAEYTLFRGLIHSDLSMLTHGTDQRRHRKILRECAVQLRRYARDSQEIRALASFLEAEELRAAGKDAAALRTYRTAARHSLERGHRQHAALIHERIASVLRRGRSQTTAQNALHQAVELYRDWGARAKVRQLELDLDLRHVEPRTPDPA
jgi:energy-coupling factor transporter ATP-binding protein EcfA2